MLADPHAGDKAGAASPDVPRASGRGAAGLREVWRRAAPAALFMSAVVLWLVATGFDFSNPMPAVVGSPWGQSRPDQAGIASTHVAQAAELTPSEVRSLFGLPGGLSGAGESIVLVEGENGYSPGALSHFDAAFGLPPADVLTLNATMGALGPAGADNETMLDVEWAHALAPGARLYVIVWHGQAAALARALGTAHPSAVAVTSLMPAPDGLALVRAGLSGNYRPLASYPTFAASGDGGAGLSLPAALPYVTAVGGVAATGGTLRPWAGSGTGLADLAILRPNWQSGDPSPWRAVPDVAWLAGPPGVAAYSGQWIREMGTSLAAPMWAALWALADQARALAGKASLRGDAAPILYSLARSDPSAFCVPHPPVAGCGSADGWHPAIGLGAPRPTEMIAALRALPADCCAARPAPPSLGGLGPLAGLLALLLCGLGSCGLRTVRARAAWTLAAGLLALGAAAAWSHLPAVPLPVRAAAVLAAGLAAAVAHAPAERW